MNDWNRRTLLRTTGAAAVAVPMAAIATSVANAAERTGVGSGATGSAVDAEAPSATHPVLFCVHDAERGEVSILHGEREVSVIDKQLVARILHAAATTPTTSVAGPSLV